jgi:hypothetical protein
VPLQLCEHGVVNFAAALEKAGATPGTAHAFLLSAPATNVATLGVVLRSAGGTAAAGRSALAISATALALSYLVDHTGMFGGDAGDSIGKAAESFELPAWFSKSSTWVCCALLAASLFGRVSAACSSSSSKSTKLD